MSLTSPGSILTPIDIPALAARSLWVNVATSFASILAESHSSVLPTGPAKQLSSCAPPGTFVVIEASLISGLPLPSASQKNSSYGGFSFGKVRIVPATS